MRLTHNEGMKGKAEVPAWRDEDKHDHWLGPQYFDVEVID